MSLQNYKQRQKKIAKTSHTKLSNRRRPNRKAQWEIGFLTLKRIVLRFVYAGTAILALILLVFLANYTWKSLQKSQYFIISEVQIEGTTRVSEEQIKAALGLIEARSLLTYDIEGAASALLTLPYLAKAKVERVLPNRLLITVTERKPIAIVALSSLYLLDESGTLFKRFEQTDPGSLPVLTGLDKAMLEAHPQTPQLLAVLSALRVFHRLKVFTRLPVAEMHFEKNLGVTLVLAPLGTRVSFGAIPEDGAGVAARLERLEYIASALEKKDVEAKAIFLDNMARPERVAVQLVAR